MRDFGSIKRQITDRVDIVELVSEHVTLRRSGRRWLGLCPFHAEKTPSFTVSPDRGSFKCFGCGKGGDIFSFVELREHLTFGESLRILADRAGIDLGADSGRGKAGPGRADLAKVNAWATKFFRAELNHETKGESARKYLQGRNISDETAERFSLGLATGNGGALIRAASAAGFDTPLLLAADLVRSSDRGDLYNTFRDRLMFPIRDATTRVSGFGGRTLVDDRAKYLNTRQNVLFEKGRGLYGIDVARDAMVKLGRAVVVEGYTDCLAAHQAGFCEVVATLGTALTDSQVDLLRRYCEELILLFDSDEAGEAAADRAIRIAFPRCVKVRLARLADGKDPAEFLERGGASEFSDLLNGAPDALEFKWLQTRERFGANVSNAKRREAVLDFMRVVSEAAQATAVDAIQKGQMVIQVAHLLRMDRDDVSRLMFRVHPKTTSGLARPGERGGQKPREVPRNGEHAAWTRWLEVVLNEPGLWEGVEKFPDVSRIADQLDRRIASIVQSLLDRGEGFRLADVSALCHCSEEVERVFELAHRGAERGNFEQTFRWSLDRLRRAELDDEMERHRERCVRTSENEEPSSDSLAIFGEDVRRHRSYAPRRLIRGHGRT